MRAAIVTLVTLVAFLASAIAGPRKVLVLPLDGDAPAEQKSQLNDSIARLTRDKADGDVTVGDTTFAETAAAVGCNPKAASCAETVRSTLGVDELVYGTAESHDGKTKVTVRRAVANSSPSSQTATIEASDSGDRAEPALAPVFSGSSESVSSEPAGGPATGAATGAADGSAAAADRPRPGGNFFDTRERKLGVGLAAGGAISLVIGFSFWASKSDLQDQIDNSAPRTFEQIEALKELEDRAASKAMWGNIMVALGIGLGGAGAYFLYKDHKNRSATVAPAPVEAGTGATVNLRGTW
jgi:hypothetical protein